MKNHVENPRTLCALNGALGVFSSLGKAIPILHAGPGCGLQASIGVKAGYTGGGTGCPSSNMFEREVVFGGINRLRETIDGTLEVMDGDLYAVLTGCTAGIIGDDVESLVTEYQNKNIPIVYVDSSGFRGDSFFGYEISLTSLVKTFVKKSEKDSKTVNLFGIVPTQDITWRGNLEEITRILKKLGLKVNNFFIENQSIKNIEKSSEAAINIILSPWLLEELENIYKNSFEINSYRYNGLPIGPTATTDFIRGLAKHIEIDETLLEQVIEEEEDYVFSYYEYINAMIKTYRFVVVGDTNVVLGLTRFLVNDYGQIPLLAIITDNLLDKHKVEVEKELNNLEFARKPKIIFEDDKWKIGEIIKAEKEELTLILGSSFENEVASELDIESIVVSNPSTEARILNKSYAGYRGSLTFLEDLYDNN